jgi:hypothetical protein
MIFREIGLLTGTVDERWLIGTKQEMEERGGVGERVVYAVVGVLVSECG